MTFQPCPDGPCDTCTLRDCETHVTYPPVPGEPLTENCSPDGLVFVPNGKGAGKLYRPLKVNGRTRLVGKRAMKSTLVSRVRPWNG